MSTLQVFLSAVILSMGIVGVAANCLSLFYFIKKQNKGLGNRLLMLLVCSDLAVCLIYLPRRVLNHLPGRHDLVAWIVNILSEVIVQCSAFSTCLVSVTRAIKVCRPFYSIKGVWVGVSFLLYFLCSLGKELALHLGTYNMLLYKSSTVLIFIAVLISTVVTACCLLKKGEVDENNLADKRHATVTIFILSAVFCLLNLTFVSVYVYSFFLDLRDLPAVFYYLYITSHIAILLNSVVNPMIYVARKEDMRKCVIDLWRLLTGRNRIRTE